MFVFDIYTFHSTNYNSSPTSPSMGANSPGGDGTNIGGYTTVASLEMAGVGYGLTDYAKSNHQYKYGQRGSTGKIHSNKVITRAFKIQAYKYARYAKTAGRAVGFLGAGITAGLMVLLI